MSNKQLFFLCAVIVWCAVRGEYKESKQKPLGWMKEIGNIYANLQTVWKYYIDEPIK